MQNKAEYEQAVAVIRSRTQQETGIGLVLGSGLGELARTLDDAVTIPYGEIPGWPQSTVVGHSGELVIGRFEGCWVVAQRGRAHYYEGYTMWQVTFPIRVMYMLGVRTLILTNAAGGLNTGYKTGDIMLLNDHINLVGMTGHNPLMGPNDDSVGPRFPGMTHTYDRALRHLAHQVADEAGIKLHEGVYVCLSGPSYETPAEIRMLRIWGADAVGMSTVHEVLAARHMGMRVLAFSAITNEAIDDPDFETDTNHQEVLDAGKVIVPKLTTILRGVVRTLA
ncbi:MAG: purine-nucleoside phosphorylase [Anaerolineaceae bacterium]|nr:purine-nucleoside phosphorylase [Anaerolineaceae bacterium]